MVKAQDEALDPRSLRRTIHRHRKPIGLDVAFQTGNLEVTPVPSLSHEQRTYVYYSFEFINSSSHRVINQSIQLTTIILGGIYSWFAPTPKVLCVFFFLLSGWTPGLGRSSFKGGEPSWKPRSSSFSGVEKNPFVRSWYSLLP